VRLRGVLRRPTAPVAEGRDMSISSEEFARYAEAERKLTEEATPLLATIIRTIEAQTGLCIAEVRVTVDPANRSKDASAINCTIVCAHLAPSLDGPMGDAPFTWRSHLGDEIR
jgi:hypothetical protein